MNILELKDVLKTGKFLVTFTKKDGTTRNMLCTLHKDIIPQTSGESKFNPDIVVVYDLEKEAWRSFRFDSIIDVIAQ